MGGETPDLLDLAADCASSSPGEAGAGENRGALLRHRHRTGADRSRAYRVHACGAAGRDHRRYQVDRAWGPGAYAAVMLVRGRNEDASGLVRALGLAWLGINQTRAPCRSRSKRHPFSAPRSTVEVTVCTAPGAQVALAAVDEGILRLTGHAAPDPARWFTAKRRLGLDSRDDYGRLILPAEGEAGILRQGGDEDEAGAGLPALPFVIASLFESPRAADADGVARFRFEVPDVNTALRLSAVAWEPARTGAAALSVPVRDRLVAEPALPRFLAPGDKARIWIFLHNVELLAGYRARLSRR